MHDDEDDPMEIADDSEELAMDGPFELTKEYLDKIPGETSTVPHTIEQRVHTELLFLLAKAEAPDYLFQDIIDWAANASALNYNFRPKVSTRQAVLNDLEDHFNTEDSRPKVSELKLEGVTELIPIVHFNFRKTILSLLTNPKLMQPKNLVINSSTTKADGSIDVSPWFQPYVAPAGSCIDDVLSGSWYRDTVQKYRNVPKLFLCPLIFYVDTTFIDPMKSNFHLEPVNVTFALFKRECLMAFEFWKTLGFLCDTDDADEDHAEAGYKPGTTTSCWNFCYKMLSICIRIRRNLTISPYELATTSIMLICDFQLRLLFRTRKVRTSCVVVTSITQLKYNDFIDSAHVHLYKPRWWNHRARGLQWTK